VNRRLLAIASALGAIALLLVAAIAANPALLIAGYDTTTVEAVDGETGDSLATVETRVADGFAKQYVGLSETDELADDEGMLFVHDETGKHAYVMRGMSFGLDIVFVAPERHRHRDPRGGARLAPVHPLCGHRSVRPRSAARVERAQRCRAG